MAVPASLRCSREDEEVSGLILEPVIHHCLKPGPLACARDNLCVLLRASRWFKTATHTLVVLFLWFRIPFVSPVIRFLTLQVNICDAEIAYNYEYIGNCGCLCITPLTDRCYITLTQAQRLVLGGAPAGPAGTGKTESTKDLARALGVQCYVFNCSDQMDYKAMGQIYKGLAQTGAWGCFDEFNRIPVAVLSVCSTQYKTVLDAIRARKEVFAFEEVRLLP